MVVFFPGFENAVEDSADDFDGVGKIAAAGAGHHHPGGDECLADVAVGGGGMEILEEGGGSGFFNGCPGFHVAVEDELQLLARGREGAAFGGVFAPDGVAGVGEKFFDAVGAEDGVDLGGGAAGEAEGFPGHGRRINGGASNVNVM